MAREVDRYFNWPGQATSYMVGQLGITRLRARAGRELGPRFDIRILAMAFLIGKSFRRTHGSLGASTQ